MKAEATAGEVDRFVDVGDEVPDGRLFHVRLGLPILIVAAKPGLPVVVALVASLRRTVEDW